MFKTSGILLWAWQTFYMKLRFLYRWLNSSLLRPQPYLRLIAANKIWKISMGRRKFGVELLRMDWRHLYCGDPSGGALPCQRPLVCPRWGTRHHLGSRIAELGWAVRVPARGAPCGLAPQTHMAHKEVTEMGPAMLKLTSEYFPHFWGESVFQQMPVFFGNSLARFSNHFTLHNRTSSMQIINCTQLNILNIVIILMFFVLTVYFSDDGSCSRFNVRKTYPQPHIF